MSAPSEPAEANCWARYVRRMVRLLRRRGRTSADAEDLVQEAFVRLHSFLRQGGEVREPEAFLVRTVLNLSVDARRRERRHLYADQTVEDLPLLDLSPPPEEIFAAEQRLVRMGRTLDEVLSPRTREAYFLHRLEGFTYEEIALRLGMSIRTVEKHIARALTVLWAERGRE